MRTLPLFVLGLAACGGDKNSDTAGPEGDASPACPSYSGFLEAGSIWTYDEVADDYTGTAQVELVSIDGDVVTVSRQLDGEGTDFTYTGAFSETWSCADGLRPLTSRQDYTTDGPGGLYTGYNELSFEASGPTLPDDPAVGATWDITMTVTATTETTGDGEPTVTDVAHHFEVVSEGEVEVPAGTYTALQIADTINTSRTNVTWWSDGVGVLETSTLALTGFTAGG